MRTQIGHITNYMSGAYMWEITLDNGLTMWVNGWNFNPADRGKIRVGDEVVINYTSGRSYSCYTVNLVKVA